MDTTQYDEKSRSGSFTEAQRTYVGGEFERQVDIELAEQRAEWKRQIEEIEKKRLEMERASKYEQQAIVKEIEATQLSILMKAQPKYGIIPEKLSQNLHKLNSQQRNLYIQHLFDRIL